MAWVGVGNDRIINMDHCVSVMRFDSALHFELRDKNVAAVLNAKSVDDAKVALLQIGAVVRDEHAARRGQQAARAAKHG